MNFSIEEIVLTECAISTISNVNKVLSATVWVRYLHKHRTVIAKGRITESKVHRLWKVMNGYTTTSSETFYFSTHKILTQIGVCVTKELGFVIECGCQGFSVRYLMAFTMEQSRVTAFGPKNEKIFLARVKRVSSS